MPEPRSIRFTVDGLSIQALVWGDPEQPAIVYLPGTTGDAWNAERLADRFGDRYQVAGLDYRGHGESDWGPTPESYLPSGFLADVRALCDSFERPVIIGSSLGASLGLWYAGERPENVRALVMDDDPPEVPARHLERVLRVSYERGQPTFDDLVAVRTWYDRFRLGPPWHWPISGERLDRLIARSVRSLPDDRLTWNWDGALQLGLAIGIERGEGDLWDTYRDLPVPLLALRATEGRTCLPDEWARMQALNPRATYFEFDGAGHPLIVTREAEVFDLVERFLADSLSDSAGVTGEPLGRMIRQ